MGFYAKDNDSLVLRSTFIRGDDVGERSIALDSRSLSGLFLLQKALMSRDFHDLSDFLCFASTW